ncbi:ankyrin repeat domain-containing protein SOWAHA [Gouania willdenowi]|uniref:ankyrin repeat domain-containing protein SOWAHA n=1 Tax=Gouania willdenowi TaxID=441366 RepID=UPI001054A862|nr:ankyrin repeat domain-containing protein SOWAHA-like [Gouania willdenowi]
MAVTQESVLSSLLSGGGKMKKSEFVRKFQGAVDCLDPAVKERNRELFKTLVNNVAVVKDIDGVRYVLLRKAFRHLLQSGGKEQRTVGNKEIPLTVSKLKTCDDGDPAEGLSPIQQALQRSKYNNCSVKRTLTFNVQTKSRANDGEPRTIIKSTPPPPEIQKVTVDLDEDQRQKPVFSLVETIENIRKSSRSTKSSEDARVTTTVPLEQSEHELLVKCAAGHWSHVYGLLLRDQQLAQKKDFMSGFTALHWAAKCGNADMLVKIIDLSRRGGLEVNVNVRTHGGYTPLHIAALHDQQYILVMLVNEFGADTRIRDHCGKKAYHYLREGTSESVRAILGLPKAPHHPQDTVLQENKEEPDLFPDLSKGLHTTISRLLQPNVGGYKKKNKQRAGLRSMGDQPSDEGADSGFRYRAGSDVFM